MTLGANFRSDPGPLLPVKLLGREDICVLIVTHYDNPEGRIRTRRLFANINRNAVKTSATEDIVLDEDDGFAVLARRMLDEHEFLKVDGRVKVINKIGAGVLKQPNYSELFGRVEGWQG